MIIFNVFFNFTNDKHRANFHKLEEPLNLNGLIFLGKACLEFEAKKSSPFCKAKLLRAG